MDKIKSRLKNYGLWISILAFIPILFDSLNFYGAGVQLPDNYEVLGKAFFGILVLAGILNNPDKGKGFKDN